ncbi:MAG: DUF3786 domain-containing protein [Eubacteriales bacterium]|nr:DUF3786 domain-containing protein [Eubacteriales bacterium]
MRTDNYLIQANHAKAGFLAYDQDKLIAKLGLQFDDNYLYTTFLAQPYRIHRRTGDISRRVGEAWVDGNSYEEVMTLLDLVCDSREGRYLACRLRNMQDFGASVHRGLLESENDPWARRFGDDPEGFRRGCRALGGTPLPQGDIGYAIEVFDGLPIALQLWLGDEEFPSQLRILWDENANMYLKYETMYFARALVLERVAENM